MKICIISSSGGHLYKTFLLKQWWSKHERIWITRKDDFAIKLLKDETVFFGYFPENRNILNAVRNFIFALILLRKEKPGLVFSMGAGIAPPFMLAAKIYSLKTIFMETFIFTSRPTLSGRMLYHIVEYFIVQNKGLLKQYPKAIYKGTVL